MIVGEFNNKYLGAISQGIEGLDRYIPMHGWIELYTYSAVVAGCNSRAYSKAGLAACSLTESGCVSSGNCLAIDGEAGYGSRYEWGYFGWVCIVV